MKVTTGAAKGRALKAVPGETTRPVTDRVKQAVFNILMDDVRDSRWLDLFAGTGAIGIEALSRGAESAVFLDVVPEAIQVIKDNLKATGQLPKARVIKQDAFRYLALPAIAAFDFIYIAPPQNKDLWSRALEAVDKNPDILDGTGTVIVQIDPREYRELKLEHLELVDERKYGRTLLLFFDRLPTEIDE
ncbi:MAG TPA: 16S rRNA (guanine(966)-N(2))-methyltransferase RsmD [Thermoflexales bacterium]|nr:16S rRNA (guanine(966)-N(2))-methyltransferase RsmD [Thermoflexales bacterium]HQW35905.1 16S rRNA (guanine(966)-N(2))-methyltransferase RsmD [Thermoflexales bacterium]HQZ22108.1 16S rRNA (guanine(966)-N(2))-methyltransferase RsmD [Thermoflexales bacterium]HRA01136.1 16S rRNA (guanine(966)-N(2))-methyltransferase RsmD [Thermoflexales bacterium]